MDNTGQSIGSLHWISKDPEAMISVELYSRDKVMPLMFYSAENWGLCVDCFISE